jgi:hypothetical protein
VNDCVYISLKANSFLKQLGIPQFCIFYLKKIITETEDKDCVFYEMQEIKEIVTLLSDYFFDTYVPSVQSMNFHVMHDFIQCRNGKGCGKFTILFPSLKLYKILYILRSEEYSEKGYNTVYSPIFK